MHATKRIIVVEDELVVARDIQRSLEDLGYDVPGIASSSDQALRLVAETCPDLVLMDIRIKGDRDGIATAEVLHQRFGVPVVYLTAYADEPTVARAMLTEPYGYLVKPIKANELRSTVEIAIYKHTTDELVRLAQDELRRLNETLEQQVAERTQALRESEDRFRAFMDSSPSIAWMKDDQGRYVYLSGSYERRFRVRLEDWRGKTDFEIWPYEIAQVFWQNDSDVLTRGQAIEVVEETFHPDGGHCYWRVFKFPFRDVAERKYVGGIGVDITERERAKEALRDQEARLRAILDTAADAIITVDKQGIIQSVNAAAERLFGYATAELVGQNVKMLMPSPFREGHDGYIRRYLETGQGRIIGIGREVVGQRKNGSTFPTDLAVSEIPHMKLFTGIVRDITQRKQLEREVVEIASREQRRIGQDLHDSVGQELTALNLLASDLAEALRTNPADAAKLLERMARGLRRSRQELRAVMRGLLPVAVDTEGLMAALAELADRTQQGGKATCTFDCPEPVYLADNFTATHLYLIAQEAVHNALKHARPRNIRITLKSDGHLALRVQDDGIGMPAQPTESPGLGLRIMRSRAAIIGASLTIEPAEPTGALVTCALARKNNERCQDQEASQDSDRR